MGLMLHPNKDNPERYRVLDKELNIQKYFPYTPAGKRQANAQLKEIKQAKKELAEERSLPKNILFTDEGKVKGMKRATRNRAGRASYECFTLYAKSQQTEVIIGDNFNASFKKSIDWLLDKHGVEATPDIKRRITKAKKTYI